MSAIAEYGPGSWDRMGTDFWNLYLVISLWRSKADITVNPRSDGRRVQG